jgi:hypothetical protein
MIGGSDRDRTDDLFHAITAISRNSLKPDGTDHTLRHWLHGKIPLSDLFWTFFILERSDLADKLAGQHVDVYDFSGRPLEVRWKGHSLPYRIFSKDQRVSHTAIVEDKRLSHALATVKAQQDIKHMPTVMTNSVKGGYKKRGRQLYRLDYKAEIVAHTDSDMTA